MLVVVEVELTLLELMLQLLQVEQVEQVKILVLFFHHQYQIVEFTLEVVAEVEFVQVQHPQQVEQVELGAEVVVKGLIDRQLNLEQQIQVEVEVELALELQIIQEPAVQE